MQQNWTRLSVPLLPFEPHIGIFSTCEAKIFTRNVSFEISVFFWIYKIRFCKDYEIRVKLDSSLKSLLVCVQTLEVIGSIVNGTTENFHMILYQM